MKIIDFFAYENKDAILKQLENMQKGWGAIPLLVKLLKEGTFHSTLGNGTMWVLVDDEKLTDGVPTVAAFANFCDIDEIDTDLHPWIGFVFTVAAYRGRRLMGQIIEHCMKLAVTAYPDSEYVYISTGETGLYEKYGFTYWQQMTSRWNGETRVYRRKIER